MAEGDPIITVGDLEKYLIDWYDARLTERTEPVTDDVEVDRVEWSTLPKRLIVIRDDGGDQTSFLTSDTSIGVSVLAGTKENPSDAKELASIAYALRSQIPSPDPDNPFSALLGSTRPVMVTESQERARVYFTLNLAVAGRLL